MHRRCRLATILLLSLLAFLPAAAVYADENVIAYPSVYAAMTDLKTKVGVVFSDRDEWTVATDPREHAMWFFTPPKHPAHPAVVRRIVLEKADRSETHWSILCQASKAVCRDLLTEFTTLDTAASHMASDAAVASASAKPGLATGSTVDIEKLDDKSYRLVLKSKQSASAEAGQAELLPKARELCAPLQPLFGKYDFNTTVTLGKVKANDSALLLHQEISCLSSNELRAANAANAASAVAPARTSPGDKLSDQQVEQQTLAYFALRDGANYEGAYALFADSFRKIMPFARWRNAVTQFNTRAGAVQSRKTKKITWYQNMDGGEPGNYAAVDFNSTFANLPYHCGYLIWRQTGGGLTLVREEENAIDARTVTALSAAKLAALRKQYRCD